MAQITYQGIQFSFTEMLHEIDGMRELAKPFLEEASFYQVIPAWRRDLANFKNAPHPNGAQMFWQIPEKDPIQTKVSEGEYEPDDRRGAHDVFGRISGIWDIRKFNAKGKKKNFRSPNFILFGIASTKISVWSQKRDNIPKELARWTVEIGSASSPGCHFHTQIDLDDQDNKFPKSLSVPRLPGVLHTPMDALDFLLGELFQDKWYQQASRQSDPVQTWANCQRTRLVRLLGWQSQKLSAASGSPWTMLKRQKPELDIFCD